MSAVFLAALCGYRHSFVVDLFKTSPSYFSPLIMVVQARLGSVIFPEDHLGRRRSSVISSKTFYRSELVRYCPSVNKSLLSTRRCHPPLTGADLQLIHAALQLIDFTAQLTGTVPYLRYTAPQAIGASSRLVVAALH